MFGEASPPGTPHAGFQQSLLGGAEPAISPGFPGARRVALDGTAWLDVVPEWLVGADRLLDQLASTLPWRQREVTMYERRLAEPRLTWWWEAAQGDPPHPVLTEGRLQLGERYGHDFDSIGVNYYRDGRDSVAWHSDRHAKVVRDPVIAILVLGAPRPLLLRPKGGGRSLAFRAGHGDLLVMGGTCQHGWDHSVPKGRAAGPRISVTFRHDARDERLVRERVASAQGEGDGELA